MNALGPPREICLQNIAINRLVANRNFPELKREWQHLLINDFEEFMEPVFVRSYTLLLCMADSSSNFFTCKKNCQLCHDFTLYL
jgi:hypothetical protein